MSRRLLFISQHFHPEFFRGNDIAFDMARRGVEVTVVCGIPNYPKGKFFNGYGFFRRAREEVRGVRVIRVPVIPRGKGSNLQLAANFLSYFISASVFLPFHLLFSRPYDACFVQQLSPVMMSFPGVIFKLLTRRKLYTWVLDLWPESLRAAGGISNRAVLAPCGWFAKMEYRFSDKILVSSKGFARNICSKGNYGDKIHFMPNWAEDEMFADSTYPIPTLPDGFIALFAGNVGEAQDFESVVEVARLLGKDENIHLVVVGDGRRMAWLEEQVALYGLGDRLHLLGRYESRYMPSFFRKADCLFLALKDEDILNLVIPAKVQAYMASGKPIVAMMNGDAQELINEVGCGCCVSASSPQLMADALRRMCAIPDSERRAMGERGLAFCRAHYDKSKILDNLHKLIFPKDLK